MSVLLGLYYTVTTETFGLRLNAFGTIRFLLAVLFIMCLTHQILRNFLLTMRIYIIIIHALVCATEMDSIKDDIALSQSAGYDNNCVVTFTDVMAVVNRLHSGKSDGSIGLMSEHIKFACDDFLPRDARSAKRGIAIVSRPSVRLSVRPSVTLTYRRQVCL